MRKRLSLDGGDLYRLLHDHVKLATTPPPEPQVKPSRGRPRKQEPVIAVFRDRLRAGQSDQLWLRERLQIQRGWSGANVPSDRTIKRAIGHLYQQLRWSDGVVTKDSVVKVLAQIVGQK